MQNAVFIRKGAVLFGVAVRKVVQYEHVFQAGMFPCGGGCSQLLFAQRRHVREAACFRHPEVLVMFMEPRERPLHSLSRVLLPVAVRPVHG